MKRKRAPQRAPGRVRFRGSRGYAATASRARSAKRRKVSGSRTAMSASTLRSTSIPASFRPCMNWLYDMPSRRGGGVGGGGPNRPESPLPLGGGGGGGGGGGWG